MDGPARSTLALARITEQRQQVCSAMAKINLQLRKMALNLTEDEVQRLMVNKKDGPGAYVRLYEEHARVEKREKHDLKILDAQEKAIKKGLKKGVFDDFHLTEYPLESEVEDVISTRDATGQVGPTDAVDEEQNEADNEVTNDGLDAWADSWSEQVPKPDDALPASPAKVPRRLAPQAITTKPFGRK